jgi:TolB protein
VKLFKINIALLRAASLLSICLVAVMGCTEETFVEPKLYGSLTGQVLSLVDKKPLTNVLVRISPSGKSITPGADGKFKVDSLPVGSYSVQTSVDKYKTDLTSIQVEENQTAVLAIFMILDNNQNKPPLVPTVVKPADKGTDSGLKTTLAWKTSDPEKDSLSYSVILFKEGQSTSIPLVTGLHVDSLVVNNLEYATTYYWQVITTDSVNTPVYSKIWSFTTKPVPDQAYFFARQIAQNYQIFSSDGTEAIQITTNGGNWRPVVSPNRERLAFISNINTDAHIFVSNRLGKELKRVTVVPIAGVSLMDLSFCWSPDGTELLYPNYDKLYAVHPDGTGLRIVAQAPIGRFFAGCDWTPQGNKIIARVTGSSQYDNELYIINPSNGALSSLFSGRPGKMSNPDFAPDGKTAVFSLDITNFQNNEGRQLDARVFIIDISTGVATDISLKKVRGTNDLDPRYSPNGAQVIFTNTSNDGFSLRSILTTDTDGEERKDLLKDAEMVYWR